MTVFTSHEFVSPSLQVIRQQEGVGNRKHSTGLRNKHRRRKSRQGSSVVTVTSSVVVVGLGVQGPDGRDGVVHEIPLPPRS